MSARLHHRQPAAGEATEQQRLALKNRTHRRRLRPTRRCLRTDTQQERALSYGLPAKKAAPGISKIGKTGGMRQFRLRTGRQRQNPPVTFAKGVAKNGRDVPGANGRQAGSEYPSNGPVEHLVIADVKPSDVGAEIIAHVPKQR